MRRSAAGLILGISLLIASMAWGGFAALRTVLDPGRSADVADALLEDDEVQAQLAENLATAVTRVIPVGVPITDQQVESGVAVALRSPVVEALIRDAFVSTHAAFLGEGDVPRTVDLGDAAVEVREAIVAIDPSLDAVFPPSQALVIELPTERVPDLGGARRLLLRVVPLAALFAAGGVVLALLTTTHRPSVLRRAGRWAIVAGAVWLAFAYGIPWLATSFFSGQSVVAGALLQAVVTAMIVPSIILVAIGSAALALSFVWPHLGWPETSRRHRRHLDAATVGSPSQPVTPLPPASPPVVPETTSPESHPRPDGASVEPQWQAQPTQRWVEGVGYVHDD